MVTRLIVVPLLQALRLGSLTPLAQTLDELTLFFLALLSQLKMGLLGCLDAMLYPIQVADMAAGKLHRSVMISRNPMVILLVLALS